jgi:23S rRNA A1618 N6-methylase RlmF
MTAGAVGVLGLDIGCGANLIYPLLGAAQHGWRFIAADITDAALSGAAANLAANPHLGHLIQVHSLTAEANFVLCFSRHEKRY